MQFCIKFVLLKKIYTIKKIKPEIEKAVFHIAYKPALSFYEKLYKLDDIFVEFPHWQTDRLKVTLRDYEKKHSLTIKHDATIYETDKYSKKAEAEIAKLLNKNKSNILDKEIQRLGHRFFSLAKNDLSFTELNELLSLKFFNSDFTSIFEEKDPYDHSITLNFKKNSLNCRLLIGPIRNEEISNFINFNVDNHIDPNSINKYSEMAKIIESYPKTALFIDLDVFEIKEKQELDIIEFYEKSNEVFQSITNDLISFIFATKI